MHQDFNLTFALAGYPLITRSGRRVEGFARAPGNWPGRLNFKAKIEGMGVIPNYFFHFDEHGKHNPWDNNHNELDLFLLKI